MSYWEASQQGRDRQGKVCGTEPKEPVCFLIHDQLRITAGFSGGAALIIEKGGVKGLGPDVPGGQGLVRERNWVHKKMGMGKGWGGLRELKES